MSTGRHLRNKPSNKISPVTTLPVAKRVMTRAAPPETPARASSLLPYGRSVLGLHSYQIRVMYGTILVSVSAPG